MTGLEGGGLASDLGAMLLLAVGFFAVLGLWPRRTEQEKNDLRVARVMRRRDRERLSPRTRAVLRAELDNAWETER